MNIYDFKVKDTNGNMISLKDYEGKVLLIINTATKCGLTPQYEELEEVYKKYKSKGFEILDFPCNQFLEQSPGNNEEISEFCKLNFGVDFKIFSKIDVNGENADPLYKYLKEEKPMDVENEATKDLIEKLKGLNQEFPAGEIKWNFTKFIIDRKGEVIERYSPTITPKKLKEIIETQLKLKSSEE